MSKIYEAFLENEKALGRILGRYFKRAEDVEDLKQQTFLKCFAAETRTVIKDPRAFLFMAAKNIALSEIKKKSRTTTDYLEDFSALDVLEDEGQICADVQLDSRRKLAVLTKVVATLPDECRQAFLMRKVEKLKYSQIALRLDVSLSTVHRLVARALLSCVERLQEEGYEMAEFGFSDPGSTAKKNTETQPSGRTSVDSANAHSWRSRND